LHKRPPEHFFGRFRPAMPFGPKMIGEMSQLVFLWSISEEPEGITGYDLLMKYKAKRTNVYRTLKYMDEQGFVDSKEMIVQGRAHRIFTITDAGTARLAELKEKWTNRIAFLTDIVPTERSTYPYMQQKHLVDLIDKIDIENQEEVLEFLNHLKDHRLKQKDRTEIRLEHINTKTKQIDDLIEKVTKDENYDPDEIELLIFKILKR
jgi:DNA-binding PadR family transcriptional regulator